MLLHATTSATGPDPGINPGINPGSNPGSNPGLDHRPPLVILHGLFGNSDNWGSLRRPLGQHFRVIALDLRNHGQSGHDPAIDYALMAKDVTETLAQMQIDNYHLLGHSMGGKVAITMAGINAPGINKLVVVDIAPKDYPPHHQHILNALLELDTNALRSRNEADKALQSALPDIAVRQFILKNLVRARSYQDSDLPQSQSSDRKDEAVSGFRWLFNLEALNTNYAQLATIPVADSLFTQPLLVLRGSESDYVQPEDAALFAKRFRNFEVHAIKGAGHWPHASHTAQVIDELLTFLL